uniref:Sarcocystatin-A n=2 Tax=Lygus hesperus TaxID=30085 RepID=A0A146LH22_LYGHE
MFLKIFAVLVVPCIALADREPCLGCPEDHDANDHEVHTKLSSILAAANSPHQVKKITNIKKQVVAGMKFIVTFENQEGKECNASWVEQPWVSKDPQYVEFNCP